MNKTMISRLSFLWQMQKIFELIFDTSTSPFHSYRGTPHFTSTLDQKGESCICEKSCFILSQLKPFLTTSQWIFSCQNICISISLFPFTYLPAIIVIQILVKRLKKLFIPLASTNFTIVMQIPANYTRPFAHCTDTLRAISFSSNSYRSCITSPFYRSHIEYFHSPFVAIQAARHHNRLLR